MEGPAVPASSRTSIAGKEFHREDSFFGRLSMDYRAYVLDDNGSIVNVRELEARDDSDAVEQARKPRRL
jgi:hypothetical protein